MRGRPITNISNHWSEHHYKLLLMLAHQVHVQFKWLDVHALVNVGWLNQARYYKDVCRKAKDIKREMYKWASKEQGRQCESLDRVDVEEKYILLPRQYRTGWAKYSK